MKLTLLVFLALSITSCSAQSPVLTRVNADTFESALAATPPIQVLDVRTEKEFKTGHIRGALLADWNNSAQFRDRVHYLDKSKPVYIYCLAGIRSDAAAKWMQENGFLNIVELNGGINAWKKAGKPLEAASAEKQMTYAEYLALIPADQTVLVEVGAEWCPPCRKMEPVLDALQKDSSLHFKMVKVDAGVHTEVLKQLHIDPIPVLIIYKEGKEVWRGEGIVTQEDIAAQIQRP